jgi:hypothetical protein
MATIELIGDNAFELDTMQRQWLRDPTIDVLAICPDEPIHRSQLGETLAQRGLIRRRIVYARLG